MYQQNILDHYKHPRNFGTIENANHHAHVSNPLCGDELDFFVQFEGDKVSDVKFTGRGCTISMASASMLSDKMKTLSRKEIELLQGADAVKLLGVDIVPARLKCATLSVEAVQQALRA